MKQKLGDIRITMYLSGGFNQGRSFEGAHNSTKLGLQNFETQNIYFFSNIMHKKIEYIVLTR